MPMLTGPEIARQVLLGGVTIDPFDPARVGANSYDLSLAPELLVYAKNWDAHERADDRHQERSRRPAGRLAFDSPRVPQVLDMAAEEPTVALTIPAEGLVLWPGVLYLGATVERAGSDHYVPCLDGRSSVGRLGMQVHCTAGYGDLGFGGRAAPSTWTLEITTVVPLRIYAGVRVCQISFTTVEGDLKPYAGKYAGQTGPRASGLWRDFGPKGGG